MKEREPAYQALARRVASRRAQAAARAESAVRDEVSDAGAGDTVGVASPGYVASGPRQQPVRRPRSQRRGRPGRAATVPAATDPFARPVTNPRRPQRSGEMTKQYPELRKLIRDVPDYPNQACCFATSPRSGRPARLRGGHQGTRGRIRS